MLFGALFRSDTTRADSGMTATDWSLPRGISSFACGSDVVLFRESTGDLFLLNDTAAYIWRELQTGLTPAAVGRALTESTDVAPEQVARDIRTLIGEWERWADLQDLPPTATGGVETGDRIEPAVRTSSATGSFEGVYRLLDFCFELRAYERGDFEAVTALFDHLSVDRSVEPAAIAAVLDISRGPHGQWRLTENARLLGECDSPEGLAPLLHAEVLMAAYANVDCLAALHAAVVVGGDRAIVMPAPSGSGKSTLTAALVAAGYRYGTDDLAVLTHPPVTVRPAPVSLGLKAGSWAPLAARLPPLGQESVHVRSDGRRIRYFVPPVDRIASQDERYPAAAIVFPRYHDDAELSCRRIRPGDALLRLTQAGYDARLSCDVVAALTAWLGDIPAYELRYSNLDRAVSAIGAIT